MTRCLPEIQVQLGILGLSATLPRPLLSADLHKTGVQPTFAEWGLKGHVNVSLICKPEKFACQSPSQGCH